MEQALLLKLIGKNHDLRFLDTHLLTGSEWVEMWDNVLTFKFYKEHK